MNEHCTFRQSYLSTASYASNQIDSLLCGEFDLMLLASSWDRRSIAITAATNIRCALGLGIFFEARDHQGLRDLHDRELMQYGKNVCDRFEPVQGKSNEVEVVWSQIEAHVENLRKIRRTPLNVLIDLSACPRYFSLGLMAMCLRQRYADTVTIIYSEGEYPKVDQHYDYAFTGGRWKTVAIPYLEGGSNPGGNRFYLVSVGFEGAKTFRAVSQADPDRVSILFPDPGTLPTYAEQTGSVNKQLIEDFRVPSEQIVRAPAGDAIAAFKLLDEAHVDCQQGEHDSYLCCGTKPHSLALALRALALEKPTVLYNVPEEHKVHETKSNGIFWKYLIKDVTALS